MRTTITLDDDVSKLIETVRKSRDASLKDVINEALRGGLERMIRPEGRAKPYRIQPLDLGKCRFPNLDNVAEVLAEAEGEWHR